MITSLLKASCPPWSSDGPETRGAAFQKAAARAYAEMQAMAPRAIIDAATCCRWHRMIFLGHAPLDYYAGNFRQLNPQMPCLNYRVGVRQQNGTIIPGSHPSQVVAETLNLFAEVRLNLVQAELRWSELTPQDRAISVAFALSRLVGKFIRIHPFINGNGRTSRVLWGWGMRRFGLPFQFRITFHPEDPSYDNLMAAAMREDYDLLAVYMLQHISRYTPTLSAA